MDGLLWLSMRLVDGADLRSLVAAGRRRGRRAIVAQLGAALDAAHAQRLVHRDVKPANVLVTRSDHAYLTDFGLVKALDAAAGLTRTGDVVGTLDYVAPERIRGGGDGPAADLYSLGCVLYYALTGRVVFESRAPSASCGRTCRAAAGVPGVRGGAGAGAGEGPCGAVCERGGARARPRSPRASWAWTALDAARRAARGIAAADPARPARRGRAGRAGARGVAGAR